MSVFQQVIRLLNKRSRFDGVLTIGPRPSLAYGLLCGLLGLSSKQIMTEVFLDEPRPYSLSWRLKTALFRWISRRSLGILTNSSAEVQFIARRFGIPTAKLRFVPMYTTIEHPELSLHNEGYVLSIGRTARDLDTLLLAVPHIRAPLVLVVGEYEKVDAKGRPIPIGQSFSYAVCAKEIKDAATLLKKPAVARGCGRAERIQCLADGEEALEIAMRDAFRDATFTNDYIHACEHLHECCQNLSLSPKDAQQEYRFAKGLLFRSHRQTHRNPTPLPARSVRNRPQVAPLPSEAKGHMQYGKLRRKGLFIATGHIEAGVRILVARRCKQAGMHWRVPASAPSSLPSLGRMTINDL